MSIAVPVVMVALVGGFAGLIVLGLTLAQRQRQRRSQTVASWAAARGWSFLEQDNSFTRRFAGPPFGRGSSRTARNIVQGVWNGHHLVAFDYSYVESNGEDSTTFRFGVVALSMPAAVPTLQIGYEGGLSHLARGLGIKDIEFENHDFNRTFKVTCADRRFAYDVVHPRMMQWMLTSHGPAWRMERADVLCWSRGTVGPQVIDANIAYLGAVLAQVPDFVWDKAGRVR